LESGNPQTVSPQEYDAATFKISNPDLVSSMQGPGHYDTPVTAAHRLNGRRMKKVGRSSGLTVGTCKGAFQHDVAVPYRSDHFNATVYLRDMVGVIGDDGAPFSEGGDSGSLVVTEDGSEAVGLVVGGMGPTSIVMPILPLLATMGLEIVGSHHA
jgi:hypothetical protein